MFQMCPELYHTQNPSSSFPIDAATKEIGTKSVKLWRRYFYLLTTININTVTALGLEVSLSFDTNWKHV